MFTILLCRQQLKTVREACCLRLSLTTGRIRSHTVSQKLSNGAVGSKSTFLIPIFAERFFVTFFPYSSSFRRLFRIADAILTTVLRIEHLFDDFFIRPSGVCRLFLTLGYLFHDFFSYSASFSQPFFSIRRYFDNSSCIQPRFVAFFMHPASFVRLLCEFDKI